MTPMILLATIYLHVGDCWRETKYSGLSNIYGSPEKILEIGNRSIVFTYWNKNLEDWSSSETIQSKESFIKNHEAYYEKITCPSGGKK